MYVKYGSYTHGSQEASVQIDRQALLNDSKDIYAYRETWTIKGRLDGADGSAITTAIQSLESAYSSGGQDLYLLMPDGSTSSAHYLTSSSTLGGTKIIKPPSFPIGVNGQYSTFRDYEIIIEADVPITDQSNAFVSWEERIEFIGTGGPRFVVIECRNGPPQVQKVSDRTPVVAIQSGSAVGYRARPFPPGPIWPTWEHAEARRISPTAPRTTGSGANRQLQDFGIAWSYTFEAPSMLSGLPHAQP